MVKLELDGETRLMRVVKIKGSSQFYLCEHTEANSDARDRDTSDPYAYDSKMPGSFIKAKGRRVTVSPIGDVRDPGFKA
jgi:CRISPR-associated endonuclease Csn1